MTYKGQPICVQIDFTDANVNSETSSPSCQFAELPNSLPTTMRLYFWRVIIITTIPGWLSPDPRVLRKQE